MNCFRIYLYLSKFLSSYFFGQLVYGLISSIRLTFKSTSSLLVPTYFVLRTQSEADPKPYQPLKTGRDAKGKGRALINENFLDLAAEFEDDELDENPFRGNEMGRGGRKTYDLERRWLADLISESASQS